MFGFCIDLPWFTKNYASIHSVIVLSKKHPLVVFLDTYLIFKIIIIFLYVASVVLKVIVIDGAAGT